ncbi:MAG: P-loop NTPase, partial [Flavobacteriaceae bacterium]|nr:P-loop NTPase [Flavobacteriaceae bacterium]
MKFNKQDVERALKTITVPGEGQNMIESKAVKNIMVFADEVIVDITISNPSLQAKKRTEVDILKTIHELVYAKAKISVNVKVEASTQPKNEIKGKAIPGIQNIVAVASGKGGVGKSTVTSNLAVTLSKMGFKVGILDADIYGPSIPIMFDVQNEKPLAVNVDGKSKMKPVENYGVKVLSIG